MKNNFARFMLFPACLSFAALHKQPANYNGQKEAPANVHFKPLIVARYLRLRRAMPDFVAYRTKSTHPSIHP